MDSNTSLTKEVNHAVGNAYKNGFNMGLEGCSRSRNPFTPNTPEWRGWESGWFASEYVKITK